MPQILIQNGTPPGTPATGYVTIFSKTDKRLYWKDESGNETIVGGVQGVAQTSTSGTSIDFTGIPSWARRIVVSFNGISLSGTANIQIQLGTSSGPETTGYVGSSGYVANATTGIVANLSAGFVLWTSTVASTITHGQLTITCIDKSSNIWSGVGMLGSSNSAAIGTLAGTKTLASTLDRVRITSSNGTDTFDAGSINIQYD